MKTLYMIFAFCLVSFTASAQKITEKDLEGKWNVTRVEAPTITLDYEKGTVELSPELQAMVPPEQLEEIRKTMAGPEGTGKPIMEFAGGKMTYTMEGEREEKAYTLQYKDGKDVLNFENEEGLYIEVSLSDGILHFVSFDANGQVLMQLKKAK